MLGASQHLRLPAWADLESVAEVRLFAVEAVAIRVLAPTGNRADDLQDEASRCIRTSLSSD